MTLISDMACISTIEPSHLTMSGQMFLCPYCSAWSVWKAQRKKITKSVVWSHVMYVATRKGEGPLLVFLITSYTYKEPVLFLDCLRILPVASRFIMSSLDHSWKMSVLLLDQSITPFGWRKTFWSTSSGSSIFFLCHHLETDCFMLPRHPSLSPQNVFKNTCWWCYISATGLYYLFFKFYDVLKEAWFEVADLLF